MTNVSVDQISQAQTSENVQNTMTFSSVLWLRGQKLESSLRSSDSNKAVNHSSNHQWHLWKIVRPVVNFVSLPHVLLLLLTVRIYIIVFLAMDCGKGSKYNPSMSGCPNTCTDPKREQKCRRPNVEGCECNKGWLLSGNKCVKKADCGCKAPDGSYMEVCIADVAVRKHHQRQDEIMIFYPHYTRISKVVFRPLRTHFIQAYVVWNARIYCKHTSVCCANLIALSVEGIYCMTELFFFKQLLNEVRVILRSSSRWWRFVRATSVVGVY